MAPDVGGPTVASKARTVRRGGRAQNGARRAEGARAHPNAARMRLVADEKFGARVRPKKKRKTRGNGCHVSLESENPRSRSFHTLPRAYSTFAPPGRPLSHNKFRVPVARLQKALCGLRRTGLDWGLNVRREMAERLGWRWVRDCGETSVFFQRSVACVILISS